jgi:hypothetical protein
LNPAGCQALEVRFSLAGRDGFANLELPSPQTRLNLYDGEFNASPVHDFACDSDRDETSFEPG